MDFFTPVDRPVFIEGCMPTPRGKRHFKGYEMDDGTIHFEWEKAGKDDPIFLNVAGRDEQEMKYFYDAMQESSTPRTRPSMTAKEATEIYHTRREHRARANDSKVVFGPTGSVLSQLS